MKLVQSALASERLCRLLFPPEADELEKSRLLLIALSLLLLFVILAGSVVYNVISGHALVVAGDLLLAGVFLVALLQLKNAPVRTFFFRLGLGILTVFLLYMVWSGTHAGTTILWLYVLPPVIFFLLGQAEGLAWAGLGGATSALLLLWPEVFHTYPYPGPFRARFMITFGIVILFSYTVEKFRNLAHQKVLAEKALLAKALEEIRVLKGILPICSFCKQIKDQEGNWRELESYFHERGEIGFSHGVCPDCLQKHYPDLED